MTYAFEATGLVKRFGATVALAGVDLAARQGSVLAVLGPNGAGKTTAVRILATLLRPDEGRATVGGLDVVKDAARVRREIGLTGQYASVDETLTGTENLVLIGRLLDLPRRDAKARARELLNQFDLGEAADRLAKTYSGGMRRRLDLAASLVGRPSVLYLDEPTTGLDPAKREDVWVMIRDLADDGVTVLLTTQYLEEADALADNISVIDEGLVIAHGSPAELKRVVGGQSVTVRPADPTQVDAAAAILSAVAGRAATSPGRGVVRVPVESDAALPDVIRRLGEAGISVTELSLHLPSLDEVFFTLTRGTDAHAQLADRATDHSHESGDPDATDPTDTKAMAHR
jgi:oleandomycin transport system ATP-binding protein